MSFPALTISPRRQGHTKSRTFRARRLGAILGNTLWDCGATSGAERPVWLAVLATPGEARPFVFNLRAGRRAEIHRSDPYQIPKKAGHRWDQHPVTGGVISVAYLPELFHLDPVEPFLDTVRFVSAPTHEWVEKAAKRLRSSFGESAQEAARAALVAAYFDRRTPLPLLRNLQFQLDLYRKAREEAWCDLAQPTPDIASCGIDSVLGCRVEQEVLAELIRDTTAAYRPVVADPVTLPLPMVGAPQPDQLAFSFD